MRLAIFRIIVRLAFTTLVTGNLTLKLADAHDLPLHHLHNATTTSHCLGIDSDTTKLKPSPGIGCPISPARILTGLPQTIGIFDAPARVAIRDLRARVVELNKLSQSSNLVWRTLVPKAPNTKDANSPAARFEQTILVKRPSAGSPPSPPIRIQPTYQAPVSAHVAVEVYLPYDLAMRDWRCGTLNGNVWDAKLESDSPTAPSPCLAEVDYDDARESFQWLASIQPAVDAERVEQYAFQLGLGYGNLRSRVSQFARDLVSRSLPARRTLPLYTQPNLVWYQADNGLQIVLSMEQAKRWNLIERSEPIRKLRCPLAEYCGRSMVSLWNKQQPIWDDHAATVASWFEGVGRVKVATAAMELIR